MTIAKTHRREDLIGKTDAEKVTMLLSKNQHLISKNDHLLYKNVRLTSTVKALEARIESVTRRLRDMEKYATDQAAIVETQEDQLAECDDVITKLERLRTVTGVL